MIRFCARRSVMLLLTAFLLACCTSAIAQPGMKSPEHDLLKKDVGTWDATMKIWVSPDAEPIAAKGVEKNELFGNGLWLLSEYQSESPEMPFSGRGAFGYDPVEKKYTGLWIDSMAPYYSVLKGDYDPETKTMTMTAEARDAESGKMQTTKHISKYTDDDTRVFELFVPGDGDDKEWKMVEIEYKRRK